MHKNPALRGKSLANCVGKEAGDMAKAGRPHKNDDTTRGRRIIVRYTDAEAAQLVEMAIAAGFPTVSEYVRATTLKGAVKPARRSPSGDGVFSRDDRTALLNIGNNLNQAVRVMHGGREFIGLAEVAAAAKKLDAVLDRYLP